MSVIYEKAVAEDLNLGHGNTDATNPAGGTLTGTKIGVHTFIGDAVLAAHDFPGADAGIKIRAAIAALPANGGVVDATGLFGAQTITVDPFNGLATHVLVLLGAGTYTLSTTITLRTGQGIIGVHNTPSVINYSGSAVAIKTDPDAVATSVVLEQLTLTDTGTGTVGFDCTTMSSSFIKRVVINNFATGILLGGNATTGNFYNGFENVYTTGCTNGIIVGGVTGVLLASANSFFNCRNLGDNTGIRIRNGYGNRFFGHTVDSTVVGAIGVRFEAGQNNVFQGYLEAVDVGHQSEAANFQFSGSAALHNIVMAYYDGVAANFVDNSTGLATNANTWQWDSFFYNNRFMVGQNGRIGLGAITPTNVPTAYIHIKPVTSADTAANIKLDNTPLSTGRQYQLGPGVVDNALFSIYDVASGKYVTFNGANGDFYPLTAGDQLGTASKPWKLNATHIDFPVAGPQIFVGTGTPESAQAAGVGSIFLRSDGGASTTLYVKQSGTGNTGWVGK
jgi:hypothetical protein